MMNGEEVLFTIDEKFQSTNQIMKLAAESASLSKKPKLFIFDCCRNYTKKGLFLFSLSFISLLSDIQQF